MWMKKELFSLISNISRGDNNFGPFQKKRSMWHLINETNWVLETYAEFKSNIHNISNIRVTINWRYSFSIRKKLKKDQNFHPRNHNWQMLMRISWLFLNEKLWFQYFHGNLEKTWKPQIRIKSKPFMQNHKSCYYSTDLTYASIRTPTIPQCTNLMTHLLCFASFQYQ